MNKYRETAALYDLDQRGIVKDDISFYKDHARKQGLNVLEVACGTGRVSIPLAREGYHVTAFDLSQEMINICHEKLSKEHTETRKRLHAFVADMTEYKGSDKFPLIIIPFRAFQLLTNDDQVTRFLTLVREQLAENGLFIINTYKPYAFLDQSWVSEEKEDWVQIDPITKKEVRRTHIRRKIDTENQVTYPELIYYVKYPDGKETKHVEKLAMKYYYENQLRELLVSNGFTVKEEYGYYDYRPIENGPELIFVCTST